MSVHHMRCDIQSNWEEIKQKSFTAACELEIEIDTGGICWNKLDEQVADLW